MTFSHTCLNLKDIDTSYVTIDGGLGDDSILNAGSYVSIVGGEGKDTIYSVGLRATIDGGEGNNSITNKGTDNSIVGGVGKDSIYSHGDRATIDSGEDDDSVYNYSATGYARIDAGNGNNHVYNNSYQSTITAGDGNNYVENRAFKSTITSGAGDDTVYNYSSEGSARIDVGDGDDTIYGWRQLNGDDYDIVGLNYGSGYDTYAVGKNRKDLLVKLKRGLGSVRFVDVLEAVPPFDSLIAVTIDNDTELNAKIKPTDRAAGLYDLNKATSVFGETGDIVTIQNDDSAIIIKRDGSKATVGSDDEKITLRNEADPEIYSFNSFAEGG